MLSPRTLADLDAIGRARSRIAAEVVALEAAIAAACPPFLPSPLCAVTEAAELRTRADAARNVLRALDRFLDDVVPDLEAAAAAGDADAAARLERAAANIARSVVGYSPGDELMGDLDALVRETAADVLTVGVGLGVLALILVAAYVLSD